MVKQWLAMAVALAVVSQGIAHADELAHAKAIRVSDGNLLVGHEVFIDGLTLEGGAERSAIARPEIQSAHYQQSAHQARARATVVLAVVVAAGIILAALGLRFR